MLKFRGISKDNGASVTQGDVAASSLGPTKEALEAGAVDLHNDAMVHLADDKMGEIFKTISHITGTQPRTNVQKQTQVQTHERTPIQKDLTDSKYLLIPLYVNRSS